MKKNLLISFLTLLPLGLAAQSYAPQPGEIRFQVFQSTKDYTVKQVRTTSFSPEFTSYMKYIDLDTVAPSHKFQGLGISMTDASCYLLSQLSKRTSGKLLREAFTPEGLNMSVIRLNCGASDYSTALYNYDSHPGDVDMKYFSIARDEQYMIPVIKRTLKMRKDMLVFASVWSVPGWMKTSGQMCGGSLLDEYMPAFASYWAAYLKAYQNHGIHVDAITVQNEPLTDQKGANPATLVSQEQETTLAGKLLPEAFKRNNLDTKIWIHDYNYRHTKRVIKILSDPDVKANVSAVAWHPYSGKPEMIKEVRKVFPDVEMHLTERGMNLLARDTQNEKWCADLVLGALNNGCSTYSAWNLALDEDGQPVTGRYYCRGLFEVNLEKDTYSSTPLCTLFRHIGPFVEKEADIMDVQQPDENLTTITFRNPDGQFVVVVVCDNMGGQRQRVQLKFKDQYLAFALPLYTWSISTIVIDKQ